jgi:Tol biopolymer transport system component
MTMRGVILGTAAYMAPEQAKGRPVDKRADIWAFGCVLYEMITGKRAFDGEDVTDTIAAVVTRDPDWSRLPASTPTGVRRLLTRCLAKDRKHRLRDIGDALYELTEDALAIIAPPPARAGRAPWTVTAAAGLAAALLAIPAITHYRERAAPPLSMRLTIDAPANSVRLLSPEISPDGRAVAFSSIGSGALAPRLWIRRLDEPEPTLAPSPIVPTGPPFWSPDGKAMAVPTRDGLLHLDLATGGTRVLGATRSTMVGVSQFSGSWSRDGVLLYGLGSKLFRVSESGGDTTPVALDGLAADADVRFPTFLPDGRRFLFMARERGESYLYAGSLDGGAVTRLFLSDSQGVYTEPARGRGHVLYVRDENLMAQPFDLATMTSIGTPSVVATGVPLYIAEFIGTGRAAFTVSPDGVLVYTNRSETLLQRLVWLNREGKEVGTIGEPALYFGPRISPDGTRVAVARLDERSRLGDIYVLSDGGGSQRLTFDEANDLQPVWTPDGQSILWGSQRGATSMLVRKRADGTGAEEILHRSEHPLAPDDVSSDGRHVVFRESTNETRNDLWILPLDGSGKARPLLNTPADEPRARFSPDGRLIGYISDASGRFEAYVQPFPDMNGKWQVSDGAGQVPQWRRDGREVYYSSAATMWSRPVLSLNPLQLGKPVALFAPPVTPRGSFFHVASDGQRFLFAPERFSSESLRFHIAVGWMKP